MKIGVDHLSINPSYKGGVSTYAFGLLDGLLAVNKNNIQYVVFIKSKDKSFYKEYLNNDNLNVIIVNHHPILKKTLLLAPYLLSSIFLWEKAVNVYAKITGIKKLIENNCDILYTPTTVLNFYNLAVPTLLSMHDIQQFHYPEYFSNKELKLRRLTFTNSSKFATYFQASSQFIMNDLLEHFPHIREKQIIVIPEGVNINMFQIQKNINIKEKYNLPDNFLFFPAQLWKHKNHITVLKALKKIEINGLKIPLVMTGAKYSASNDIFSYIAENEMDYIYYLGVVEFNDLVALYQEACFFITAALYESSSLSILESAASNSPIISSKTPPNIEMSENLKIYMFSPLNEDDCANVITNCWNFSSHDTSDIINNNAANIDYYSWENIAEKYINFIVEEVNIA
jgi:glycosyltransferase involved in cell wall biosynthesis